MFKKSNSPILWPKTLFGKLLLDFQKDRIGTLIKNLHWRHAIVLPVAENLIATDHSVTAIHQFRETFSSEHTTIQSPLIIDSLNWPISAEILDLVFLDHVLESTHHPHRLLSEATNSIKIGGKLIIAGFNPISFMQCVKWFLPKYRKAFKKLHFIRAQRMCDWLTLLNFQIESIQYSAYLYPSIDKKDHKLWWLEHKLRKSQLHLGFLYVLYATRKKRFIGTPTKIMFPMGTRFPENAIVRPSAFRKNSNK